MSDSGVAASAGRLNTWLPIQHSIGDWLIHD